MSEKEEKLPGKVMTIGTLMTISGILIIMSVISSIAVLLVLAAVFSVTVVLTWLGIILFVVAIPYLFILAGGIVDLIFGIRILTGKAPKSLPIWSPIMEIIFGIYLISGGIGIIVLGIGIANLILLLQDDARMYFYKRSDWD
ncbi:MAG: hypothetical protein ACMUIG_09395 [Thermoplasmatota archaeon]